MHFLVDGLYDSIEAMKSPLRMRRKWLSSYSHYRQTRRGCSYHNENTCHIVFKVEIIRVPNRVRKSEAWSICSLLILSPNWLIYTLLILWCCCKLLTSPLTVILVVVFVLPKVNWHVWRLTDWLKVKCLSPVKFQNQDINGNIHYYTDDTNMRTLGLSEMLEVVVLMIHSIQNLYLKH